jgi:nitrite reductase/ring-hydroxylating ferredoxin subunit
MGPFDCEITPEDLQKRSPRPFESPWGALALVAGPGGPVCVPAVCPHMEGPLAEGTLAQGQIVCPWHLWSFSVTDGGCLDPPEGEGHRIQCFQVTPGPRGTFLVEPRPA